MHLKDLKFLANYPPDLPITFFYDASLLGEGKGPRAIKILIVIMLCKF